MTGPQPRLNPPPESRAGTVPAPDRASPVLLVGNPNVGKSVLFGALTGRYVTVANYPGTTVELARGRLPDGTPVLDTPGLNSLGGCSDDERVARRVLLEQGPGARAVVQVADARSLRRALLLTAQLAEWRLPLILALNMIDEAGDRGVHWDTARLQQQLGIVVVPTVAVRGTGLKALLQALPEARPCRFLPGFDPPLETRLENIARHLPEDAPARRGAAISLLAGESVVAAPRAAHAAAAAARREQANGEALPISVVLNRQRLRAVDALLADLSPQPDPPPAGRARRLARWTIHPLAGWPILLAVLAAMYQVVGKLGAGILVDLIEGTLFARWFLPAFTGMVETWLPVPLLRDLLVGEFGLITMALTYGLAIVLPIVTTFFIAFSILEDTGYLPCLAVMLNRIFRSLGLNGKAVLPMVLGLGCDTMATMTTRILDTRRERVLVTLLLALGVPCSAQLGVLLGMMSTIHLSGVLIWGAVVGATLLLVGFLAGRALPGERSDFILELPPLRWPRPANLALKTLARVEWYLKEALPLFALGTLILFVLDRTGLLGAIETAAAPVVVRLLDLPPEAAGAFLIGFLRRDYGAAGLFAMALAGSLDTIQVVVSLVVITLFMPCIANVLIIVKEYGWRVAAGVTALVFPMAFAVGGLVNAMLRL